MGRIMKIKQIILSAVVLSAFSFWGEVKAEKISFSPTPETKIQVKQAGGIQGVFKAGLGPVLKACAKIVFPESCSDKKHLQEIIRGLSHAYGCYGGGETQLTTCLREFLTALERSRKSPFNSAFDKFATTITGKRKENEFRQIIRILTFNLLKNSGITPIKATDNLPLIPSKKGQYKLVLDGISVSITPQQLAHFLGKIIQPKKNFLGKKSLLGGTEFISEESRKEKYAEWKQAHQQIAQGTFPWALYCDPNAQIAQCSDRAMAVCSNGPPSVAGPINARKNILLTADKSQKFGLHSDKSRDLSPGEIVCIEKSSPKRLIEAGEEQINGRVKRFPLVIKHEKTGTCCVDA